MSLYNICTLIDQSNFVIPQVKFQTIVQEDIDAIFAPMKLLEFIGDSTAKSPLTTKTLRHNINENFVTLCLRDFVVKNLALE